MVSSPSAVVRVIKAVLWFTMIQLAVFPLVAWFGERQFGEGARSAAMVAGAICWPGVVSALVVTLFFRGQQAVAGMMLGMLVRLTPPLGLAWLAISLRMPLADAGLAELIVVYYLIALAVEITLSVRLLNATRESQANGH